VHAKSPQWPAPRGPTRSCRLGVLGHLPLSRLVRRRGWPSADYSGFANPSSGVFVCWNKISAHECRQSPGLLGRAAVIVTRYERIERMVPHSEATFIIIGTAKIKAIMSSFGAGQRINDYCAKPTIAVRKLCQLQQTIFPIGRHFIILRGAWPNGAAGIEASSILRSLLNKFSDIPEKIRTVYIAFEIRRDAFRHA
jgi:hypothetical protein